MTIKIKPENKGKLHQKLGIPQGEKIPAARLEADPHDSPAVAKEKLFARNAKKFKH